MNETIDALQLNIGGGGLMVMNISLAVIMFGVALELKISHFKAIAKQPKGVITGFISQFLFLPAITLVLIWLLEPYPSFALGMMMVAACPGGNISNFFSQLAGGNTALSISLTAIATLLAVIATPLNFTFWASLYPPTADILREIQVDIVQVFQIVGLILGIPLILGMLASHYAENYALQWTSWIKRFGIVFFGSFVVVAFSMNFEHFLGYVHLVIGLVFLHNLLALLGGYSLGKLSNLPAPDCKSIAIETGRQNSGLGLLLIFSFFGSLGGMALIAAWWGIWHIIVGFIMSWYWSTGKTSIKKLFSNA